MSDRKMRELLMQVIADIDQARRSRPVFRRRLGAWLAPPLLAASLGLAGCDDTAVGTEQDGTVNADAMIDAGPPPDALYMAPPLDAEIDTGVMPPYMAPPFDAGPDPDYASPFDASVDDGGSVPLYMGPPPQPE